MHLDSEMNIEIEISHVFHFLLFRLLCFFIVWAHTFLDFREKESSTSAHNKPEGTYSLLIPIRSEAEETLSLFFICFSGSEIQGTLHRLLISWLEVKPRNT